MLSSSSSSSKAQVARASQSAASRGSVADCTGVLLVGGASRRFGSPKALARFEGETLADRAWRTLAWCSERIAVGKAGDELPVAFDVIDDGVTERAAIYGVVAGLRAAKYKVCLMLPVDCPLIGEGALQTLAAAVAVPQSGPLPGAYSRAMLPELERRIAVGDLALRGVNPRVLQIDRAFLMNINRPEDLAALTRR
jgi:molybdopterin-guanine dinucleotide biosynthesis protein A